MKYNPPTDNSGNPYYVPIVAKNRDFLVGYLRGLETAKDIIKEVLESINLKVDLGPIDVVLDSTRFNDILENGKHESEMTDKELKEYILGIVDEITDKLKDENSENNVYDDEILKVDCTCGLGYMSWTDFENIPQENYVCGNCGRVLIHYTGVNDYDYEYDEGEFDD